MHDSKNIKIDEYLEQSILYGLVCEWEHAARSLDGHYRQAIRRPSFSLGDMKSKLGRWSGSKNEIRLSRDLVLNHSWDSVREVLLHEMAHQFACQVFGAWYEKSHGPTFRKACDILRADPKASGSYAPLDERILSETHDESDKILVRIKKLMALAQSRNKHEAEAAMIKAHQLIAKYNVDLLERKERRNYVSIFIGDPALRHFREEYHLAGLIQDYYFVEGIWVPAYVIAKGKMGRVLEISGTESNVRMADYVHAFVCHFTDSSWSKYNKGKKLGRYRKSDFAVGIIEGFRSKLEAQHEENGAPEQTHALVKIRDPLLAEYLHYRYPRLRSFRRNGSSQDDDIYNDGIQVGKKLVIAKGITDTGESGRYLEGPLN